MFWATLPPDWEAAGVPRPAPPAALPPEVRVRQLWLDRWREGVRWVRAPEFRCRLGQRRLQLPRRLNHCVPPMCNGHNYQATGYLQVPKVRENRGLSA
jgi:hypothetical protein